jgi:biotin carboxyl carrier protein
MMEKLRITVNGRSYDVMVEVLETDETNHNSKQETEVFPAQPLTAISGGKAQVNTPKSSARSSSGSSAANSSGKSLKSPMPGTILSLNVKSGETIKRGQALIILEAMKMENELLAECDGTVREIHVTQGQSVQAGELLISLT